MIPRLIQDVFKWQICWTNSLFTQIVRKIPTICLLTIKLYFWSFAEEFKISENTTPLGPSSSSDDKSSSLTLLCWHRKQESRVYLLSSSEAQLQVLSRFLLSVLNCLLTVLSEYLGKKSEPLEVLVSFACFVPPNGFAFIKDVAFLRVWKWLLFLLRDWFIRVSHLAAGSLSSITSTFPAFNGTISWKLHIVTSLSKTYTSLQGKIKISIQSNAQTS